MTKNTVTRLQTERMKAEAAAKSMQEARKNAVAMRSEAVADLKAAKALYDMGDDKATEGDNKASEGAVLLYKGQIAGLFTKEQVSAELGEVFGFKAKAASGIKTPVPASHPDASKTPFKRGEDIRKRVVRAVDAALFIEGKIARPIYMANAELTDDDAKSRALDILGSLDSGQQSIWSAYKDLGAIKEARTTVTLAFSADKLIKLAEELAKPATATSVAAAPALRSAYIILTQAIEQMFENMPADTEDDEDHAEAAGSNKKAA